MDILVYILLLVRLVAFIIFAFIKIFWFVFVVIAIRIVIRGLKLLYERNIRNDNYNRDVDFIDLFPTDIDGDSVYSAEFNRHSVKRIANDNKFI